MTDLTNVGILHKECAEERVVQFQEQNPDLKLIDQQYVKLQFKEDIHSEWIWVRITHFDDVLKKGTGTLDSEPIYLRNMKYKDIVEFEYRDVVAALEK